jgi:hypothetical protein
MRLATLFPRRSHAHVPVFAAALILALASCQEDREALTAPEDAPSLARKAMAPEPLSSHTATLLPLAQEVFSAESRVGSQEKLGTVRIRSSTCDVNGASVTFVARGPAAGPYPGTFVETGTITAGPPDAEGSRWTTAFTAEFRIHSHLGQVRGTETQFQAGQFTCDDPNFPAGSISTGSMWTFYHAEIKTHGALCIYEGTARTEFGHFPGEASALAELFTSGAAPTCTARGPGHD